MLQRATAATAEMAAGRVDTTITRFENVDDMGHSAVAAFSANSYPEPVSRRGERNIDPVSRFKRRDTIAASAKSLNRDF